MNQEDETHRSWRRVAAVTAAATLLAACGTSDGAPGQASGDAGTEPAASEPPATTAAPATTTTSSTTTTTEPPCEIKCPIADADRSLIAVSVDAYNSGDWETWTATIADDEPVFATPLGEQSPRLVEYDFIWSAAMNEVWTLGECLETRGDIHCDVTIEDDLHRGLAELGLEPSRCKIIVGVDDGLVDWKKYELWPCHTAYDQAMHGFGGWFFLNYRDQEPIDGHHYRGWNQADVTAGQRAQDHLQTWLDSGEASLGHELH